MSELAQARDELRKLPNKAVALLLGRVAVKIYREGPPTRAEVLTLILFLDEAVRRLGEE